MFKVLLLYTLFCIFLLVFNDYFFSTNLLLKLNLLNVVALSNFKIDKSLLL